jgi:hypothetical protein
MAATPKPRGIRLQLSVGEAVVCVAWMRMMGADSVGYHEHTVAGRGDDPVAASGGAPRRYRDRREGRSSSQRRRLLAVDERRWSAPESERLTSASTESCEGVSWFMLEVLASRSGHLGLTWRFHSSRGAQRLQHRLPSSAWTRRKDSRNGQGTREVSCGT